jgi:hypothetical protein
VGHALGGAAEDGCFIRQGGADGADQVDVALFPGVDGLAVEGEAYDVAGADAQGLCRAAEKQGLVRAHGEVEVVDLKHGWLLCVYTIIIGMSKGNTEGDFSQEKGF